MCASHQLFASGCTENADGPNSNVAIHAFGITQWPGGGVLGVVAGASEETEAM
jgi:hypothetical protein